MNEKMENFRKRVQALQDQMQALQVREFQAEVKYHRESDLTPEERIERLEQLVSHLLDMLRYNG